MKTKEQQREETKELLRTFHDFVAATIAVGMVRAARQDPYYQDGRVYSLAEDLAKQLVDASGGGR